MKTPHVTRLTSWPNECHLLIAAIIKIRRGSVSAKEEFYDLIDGHLDIMIERFTIRWLISICNTFVDIDKKRAPIALNIVQAVNGLFEHHRLLIKEHNKDPDYVVTPAPVVRIKMSHELGGIITCEMSAGDVISTMMVRVNKIVEQDEQLNKIWGRIKALIAEDNWKGDPFSNGNYDDFNGTILREFK
jgi:hypothetical protein